MTSTQEPPLVEEKRSPQTIPVAIPDPAQTFNWRNCWYPVTFVQDMPKDRPYSFSLYDEPLVLFRNQNGEFGCVVDRCPHRAAKLSDGQIFDGKLECLYHGWQFGIDGECLHIPQLPSNGTIPKNACIKSFKVIERQGMIWMWAGEAEEADEKLIPTIPNLDKPEFVGLDLIYDRPYDQTYFIENVIDPAHVPISHHGSDGNRQNAQPLEMEILETSIAGIRGRYRGMKKPHGNWINLDFIAPNLVLYQVSDLPKPGFSSGLALYSVPLGKGRCRVLSRFYWNFSRWKIKLQPRWFSHWYRSRVIEEDIYISRGVQAQVEHLGQNLKEIYLPLKTSDMLAIEYRKWLDKYGSSLPFYQGYETLRLPDNKGGCNHQPIPLDRFSGHTEICISCNRAYQTTIQLKQVAIGVAIAMAALAIVTDEFSSKMSVLASLSAVGIAFIAEKVKTKFERSYTRH
ncbi:MAG TPA: Rieske 2Fe-2S domain-containing protein [Leptolyngbyaceae cyanobacterium]